MSEIPKSLPEFLAWAATSGGVILVGLLITLLKNLFPQLKAWLEAQSPAVQQALAVAGSMIIGLGAALARFGFGYVPAPESTVAWVELLFGYLFLPLISGLSLRQVIVVNPRMQRLFARDRSAYRASLN